MDSAVRIEYIVPGDDFSRAGEASGDLKFRLKQLGLPSDVVRRVAIALYEAEINAAIHAGGGTVVAVIDESTVSVMVEDDGPGIEDVALAMQEGYSTAKDYVRTLGFGAGMGLPNIKKYVDTFSIDSAPGRGTRVKFSVKIV